LFELAADRGMGIDVGVDDTKFLVAN